MGRVTESGIVPARVREAGSGLVPPAIATHIYGSTGAVQCTNQIVATRPRDATVGFRTRFTG